MPLLDQTTNSISACALPPSFTMDDGLIKLGGAEIMRGGWSLSKEEDGSGLLHVQTSDTYLMDTEVSGEFKYDTRGAHDMEIVASLDVNGDEMMRGGVEIDETISDGVSQTAISNGLLKLSGTEIMSGSMTMSASSGSNELIHVVMPEGLSVVGTDIAGELKLDSRTRYMDLVASFEMNGDEKMKGLMGVDKATQDGVTR